MKTTYNHDSLKRHKVTEEEADEVYATGIDFDLEPSEDGNDRIMVVAVTSMGRLLEIGIEYRADGNEHVFHASDATKPYQAHFEKYVR